MTDQELLKAFREIIKPIHLFHLQVKSFQPDFGGYTIPLKYVKAFSDLYLELEKNTQEEWKVGEVKTIGGIEMVRKPDIHTKAILGTIDVEASQETTTLE